MRRDYSILSAFCSRRCKWSPNVKLMAQLQTQLRLLIGADEVHGRLLTVTQQRLG